MWHRLSYRFRLPLSLAATALFTALVVSLVVAAQTYRNVRLDLIDNGTRLNAALAQALQPALLHDDVWHAFNILRGSQNSLRTPTATFVLLDAENRIFASNAPRQLPVAVALADADPELAETLGGRTAAPIHNSVIALESMADRLLFAIPIESDGEPIGSLLQVYPRAVLWPRFYTIIQQGALSVGLVLAIILPLGWLSGRRMVQPLVRLADCMVRMRTEDPDKVQCSAVERDDEIGRLSVRFHELLVGLREKRGLERQMVSSERLAAVGRLAAGVAHEINNPLGGMLLAIDTLRKRGVSDANTQRTLALLERGLQQIQATVSALLLEGGRESHLLTAQDIDDTRMLVSAEIERTAATVDWENDIDGTVPLPSTLVRQATINLLLNAAQAVPRGGRIRAQFQSFESGLVILVSNEGDEIDAETLDHLFEPYYGHRTGGSGMGLWVTHQIVQQLGGDISVHSEPGETQFKVELPFNRDLDRHHAA